MRTIWKYSIRLIDGPQILLVPPQSKLVAFQKQGEHLAVWAEVYSNAEPTQRIQVEVVGTGHSLPDDHKYFGTVQDPPFVWHLYVEDQKTEPTIGPLDKERLAVADRR